MTELTKGAAMTSAHSQEIFLHRMAARRGYRLYQWPSGSFCLVSRKSGEFCGTGVNMTLDEVAQHLLCIPELEKAAP